MLPRSFLPAFNEGTVLVGMRLQPGISLAESHRLGSIAERLILEVPDVASVGRRTGRAEADLHAEGVHAAELDVNLRPVRRPMAEIMARPAARGVIWGHTAGGDRAVARDVERTGGVAHPGG
jgi:heavy-metal exporter, HME family